MDQGAPVTGGGSGMGEATARRFASHGAKVAILDHDAERGSSVAAVLGGFFVKTDVSDEVNVEAGFAAEIQALGSASRIVVNCAGIGTVARIVGREGKAREFAKIGARVTTIAPEPFQTPMMEGLPAENTQQITADIPFLARLGRGDEEACLAESILTNPFLNGTAIRLGGAVGLPPRSGQHQ